MKRICLIVGMFFMLSLSFAYASSTTDTNGVWHLVEDVRPGVFGNNELAGPSNNYTFINDLIVNIGKIFMTNKTVITDTPETVATKSYVDEFGTPAGAVMSFAMNSCPTGWIKADGSTFSAVTYPRLNVALGSTILPDLRGYFIRGYDDGAGRDVGRTFGSVQDDSFETHSHEVNPPSTGTTSNGDHNHGGATSSGGLHTHTGSTNSAGAHSHKYTEPYLYNNEAKHNDNYPLWAGTVGYTSPAGAHIHSLTINSGGSAHTHPIPSSGNHEHDVDITTFDSQFVGGGETRPTNIALLYCIKY